MNHLCRYFTPAAGMVWYGMVWYEGTLPVPYLSSVVVVVVVVVFSPLLFNPIIHHLQSSSHKQRKTIKKAKYFLSTTGRPYYLLFIKPEA